MLVMAIILAVSRRLHPTLHLSTWLLRVYKGGLGAIGDPQACVWRARADYSMINYFFFQRTDPLRLCALDLPEGHLNGGSGRWTTTTCRATRPASGWGLGPLRPQWN